MHKLNISITVTFQEQEKQDVQQQVISPVKPVNLLPEIPAQTGRQLNTREQRDCEVGTGEERTHINPRDKKEKKVKQIFSTFSNSKLSI